MPIRSADGGGSLARRKKPGGAGAAAAAAMPAAVIPGPRAAMTPRSRCAMCWRWPTLLHITVVPENPDAGPLQEVLAGWIPNSRARASPARAGSSASATSRPTSFWSGSSPRCWSSSPRSSSTSAVTKPRRGRGWPVQRLARLEREGLKTPAELQAYAVHRIGRFLEAHGRRLVGLGRDPRRQHPGRCRCDVRWRGEEGGRRPPPCTTSSTTPCSYCYFDGYQDNPMTQPQAFTGYLPLEGLRMIRLPADGGRRRAGRAGQPLDGVHPDPGAGRIHAYLVASPWPRWRGAPKRAATTTSSAPWR